MADAFVNSAAGSPWTGTSAPAALAARGVCREAPGRKVRLTRTAQVRCVSAQVFGPREVQTQTVKLYYNRLCPYAARTWLALEEKKVSYDKQQIGLTVFGEEKQAWFVDAIAKSIPVNRSKLGTVPALSILGANGSPDSDSARFLVGSAITAEFVDDFGSDPAAPDLMLRHGNPLERAELRYLLSEIDVLLSRCNALIVNKNPSNDVELKDKISEQLEDVEALLELNSYDGKYCMGDFFTLADCAMAPLINRFAVALPELRSYKLLDRCHRLEQLDVSYSARPAYLAIRVSNEEVLEKYGYKARR
ncbi:putative glutathione S-transferase [Porphyridium purpureum]|uniref:Putative glutathione S-transferase n=1 Tax=Porphyridium purpureum TaxID=35688 RepID=A0A5J4Z6A8_PORPP|nr:putative glutathione S-transferase [Porphyridium purpureum]|eukprot:POR4343..scf295_1